MITKTEAIEMAIAVAKESARGGNANPAYIFQSTYEKIVEVAQKENELSQN